MLRRDSLARRLFGRARPNNSRRPARRFARRTPRFESLEPRSLLASQFVINEFLAANGNGLVDGFGERSDWIEIRNVGDAAGDLAGHHLTDSAGELDKWTFPAGTVVPAGGYLVVFASGRDTTDAQGRRHTNFSLDMDGEYLALTSPSNAVLSEYGANGEDYPPQRPNLSYGLSGTTAAYLASPTPGSANASGFSEVVGDTRFNVDRGFFDAPFQLIISTNTPGAQIRYTTNGTAPTISTGTLYTGAITIDRTTTVRALAFKAGAVPSNVDTQTYIFLDDVVRQSYQSTIAAGFPAAWESTTPDYGMDPDVVGPNDLFGGVYAASIRNDLRAIPTLSIVMNTSDMFGSNGIYSNPNERGTAWERGTSIEYVLPDGSDAFQIDGGIQIQGGAFRGHTLTKKKSFRVNFKEQYGAAKLKYPLFGRDAVAEFDNFILRAENNDGWQWSSAGSRPLYSRDEWAARTQLEMGQPAVHGHHVHVYINGVYWGMYNLVERPDDAFAAAYFGGEKEEWDAINSGTAIAGSTAAWNTMVSLATAVKNAPDAVTRVAAWQRLQGNNPDGSDNPAYEDYLDVDSLIDYMILNIYAGNNDWPSHNYYVGRRRGPESTGFKFFSWDAEWILGLNSDVNTNRTGVNINVARPYDLLKNVPEFRNRFADRVHQHFFNGGVLYVDPNNPNWDPAHPERNRPAARFVELSNEITDAIVGESARWGDQHHTVPHTRNADWQVERNRILSSYFPQRSAIVLSQLRAAGLYPNVEAPAFNQHGGQVPAGFELRMNASSGTIYYTLNGSDPRRDDGTLNPDAIQYPAVNITNTLIPRGSTWKYLDNGSNQGTTWRAATFNGASWPSGAAPLGYGDTGRATVINGGPSGNRFITTYFRRTFQVANPAEVSTLKLRVMRDDGAVIYINGQEAARTNMPSGPISSATFAAGVVGGADESTFYELNIDPGLLSAGTNVIAVELHQSGPTSTDLGFDLELVAFTTTGAPPILINAPTIVKARTLVAGTWSALNEAGFTTHAPASAANLKITELNYHPHDAVPEAGEPNVDSNQFEYVELRNISGATVDLRGVRFTNGISFDFTRSGATVLAPGEYIVVVKDPAVFATRYTTDRIAGAYSGLLDNGGERIVLVAADGSVIEDFSYDDDPPWPTSPDGRGPSLTRLSPLIDGSEPSNWSGQVPSPAAAMLPLTTINGSAGNDTFYVVRSGSRLDVYQNIPPGGPPTYSSELSAMTGTLTINTLGGDDTLIIDAGSGAPALGLDQLIYNAGTGVNTLVLERGTARIDSTAAGGTLNTTVKAGARLSTVQLKQSGLVLEDNSRVTLVPDGQTSVITSLTLGAGATLDIGNNALVLDYTGTSPVTMVREKILSGRGGAGLGASWNGTGIASSAAARANIAEPESRSIGYAENASLPLGSYTSFRGVPVDNTAILIAYSRTGDANLDGLVNDDDATVLGASYAPAAAGAVWALGDFEYNSFVDDDDATLIGAFYSASMNPPPPAPSGPEDRQEVVPGPYGPGYYMSALRAWETFGQSTVRGQETHAQRRDALVDLEILTALASSADEQRRSHKSSPITRPSESGIGRPSAV